MVLVVFVAQSSAASASPSVRQAPSATVIKKVTICHRTHSVTNPYVRITVAESSISPNAANKHGGSKHDQYSSVLYPSGKPNPNVFDSTKTYTPAPEKKWGDIVPNVYTDGTAFKPNGWGSSAFPGINFTGIGLDIYNGTNGKSGQCKSMNPRDFYEVEKANGVPESEILGDLDESKESDEFASALTACGGTTFVGCDPSKLGTMSIAPETTTTVAGATATTVAGATATTVAGSTATTFAGGAAAVATTTTVAMAAGKGAIEVKIWVDANRDGSQATDEKSLAAMTVTIKGPNGATKTAKTDANGFVLFNDLEPGSWSVVSVLSVKGYEKVYDSDGALDWASALTVTAGKVSAASYAAAPALAASAATAPSAASVPDAASAPTLTKTGTAHSGGLASAALAMLAAGLGLVALRRRRESATR